MKWLSVLTLILTSMSITAQSIHELSYLSIDGETISMKSYENQYVLVVNVASFCGYTSQYDALQELHESQENLNVIAFPCNQFGSQEPNSESEIKEFCSSKFSVDFPMSSKVDVKGSKVSSIYQWLTQKELNKLGDFEVSWNFNKFLVGPSGELIAHFPSSLKPLSNEITKLLK